MAELSAQVAELAAVEAKVRLSELHERRRLTELEQGWLVRSLHREDGLSQGAIAHELGRHKSWVCRRLLLVERLDEAVQAQVRLGLLAARAAIALVPARATGCAAVPAARARRPRARCRPPTSRPRQHPALGRSSSLFTTTAPQPSN